MDPQNNSLQNFPDETLDLKRYFFLFLGKWYFIAIGAFVGLFVAYLVNRYSEQIFSVSATLLVGNVEVPKSQGVQALMKEMSFAPQRKSIENEIGILKSYSLAQTAISELPDFNITYVNVGRRGIAESKLYNRSPFVVLLDSMFENQTGIPINITILNDKQYYLETEEGKESKTLKFGEKFTNDHFSFKIILRGTVEFDISRHSNKFYFIINNHHSLTLSYMRKVNVITNKEQGSLLTLSSTGFVAKQEADFINKLMEVYIRNDLNDKMQTAINTIYFVDEQLKSITDSLKKAELLLQNYRTQKGIINLSTEGRLLLERIEEIYNERNILTLQLEYFNYLENYLKGKKEIKGLIAPANIDIDDSGISEVVSELNRLSTERDGLLFSVNPDNIKITKLDQNITNLINLLFEKLEGMRKINKIKINEIDQRINEQEGQLRLLPLMERELLNMERMFNIHEKFYTYLMEKRIEAGIAKASNVSDNRIIDVARSEMATMVKPRKRYNNLLGIIIGLVIPMSLIFLFDLLNNSIQDPLHIGKKTLVPLIGTIGHNPYESFLPVFDKPKSSFAEAFRALRTNLEFLLSKTEHKVILVSSTISGEGKSFIASNLAISLAMLGKKTAILGLDLRKPKVHALFGVDNSKGLSTYLIGRDRWEEIVEKTNVPNLFVLPAGPIPPNPAELLASNNLEVLIEELNKNYDFIVIDSAPVAVVTDAVLISRLCDTTLFVLRHMYTSRNVLDLVEDLSRSKTIKNMALLLNDFKKPKGYGYGYNYGYGYSYGYGYDSNYGYGKGYYTDEENGSKGKWFLKKIF